MNKKKFNGRIMSKIDAKKFPENKILAVPIPDVKLFYFLLLLLWERETTF